MTARAIAPERLACTDGKHLLMAANPWADVTWCQCGKVRVPGADHKTHHEYFVRTGPGPTDTLLGYEHYTLGRCDCHPDGTVTS